MSDDIQRAFESGDWQPDEREGFVTLPRAQYDALMAAAKELQRHSCSCLGLCERHEPAQDDSCRAHNVLAALEAALNGAKDD